MHAAGVGKSHEHSAGVPPTAHVPLVVIADDEPEDIVRLEQALLTTGVRHKVVAVPSGESAMNYLQRWLAVAPPETWSTRTLLLLDWRMPAADGLAVLRWIRAQPALHELAVMMISNTERPDDIAAAQAAGANACLSKNASQRVLAEVLGEALRSCERELRKAV